MRPHECTIACATGRGTFTAAVEVRDQRQMCISFLYHLALQRNIRNPLEVGRHTACSFRVIALQTSMSAGAT